MPKLIFNRQLVLKSGTYPATLVGTESRDSDFGQTIRWTFELSVAGRTTKRTGVSSMNTGAKSKARRWASALLGRPLRDGEELDTDTLVGRECLVEIGLKMGHEG